MAEGGDEGTAGARFGLDAGFAAHEGGRKGHGQGSEGVAHRADGCSRVLISKSDPGGPLRSPRRRIRLARVSGHPISVVEIGAPA